MTKDQSRENHRRRRGGMPLLVAIAIAILGVLGMLFVDHGPWSKPKVQTVAMAHHSTTGDAARAVGAIVMPSERNPRLISGIAASSRKFAEGSDGNVSGR
jgi:hypothetical protein